MKAFRLGLLLSPVLLITLSTVALAQSQHTHGHSIDKNTHQKITGTSPTKSHDKGGLHMFSAAWMHTLSDEQKAKIDKMHLDVAKVENLLRAKTSTAKMELNLLALEEKADMKNINNKISEIADLEAGIMRNRFAHIVEMREALTPQQRISYDMSVLKRDKKKRTKRTH